MKVLSKLCGLFLCSVFLIVLPVGVEANVTEISPDVSDAVIHHERDAQGVWCGDYKYYAHEDGKTATITYYRGKDTALTIPTELDGYVITKIGDSAFALNRSIQSVVIPEGIMSVGAVAFFGDHSITSVRLPESLEVIGKGAFGMCTSLLSVEIPGTATIEKEAFTYCGDGEFEKLILSEGIKSIGDKAFFRCYNYSGEFTEVDIPASVQFIGSEAFAYCELKNVYVDDNNLHYADIDGVLFNKAYTELLYYPMEREDEAYRIPEGTVTVASKAFNNCDGLIKIEIPESVKTIEGPLFEWCRNLKEIHVDSANDDLMSQNGILFNKEGNRLIKCPPKFPESVYIVPDSVRYIENSALESCRNITDITLPESLISIGSWAFGGMPIKYVELPETVTEVGEYAFSSCAIEKIVLSPNLTEISENMFYNCSDLTHIEIPEGVISIGEFAFSFCTNLVSAVLPESLEVIGNSAFSLAENLCDAEIPTNILSIGAYAFSSTSIQKLTLPENITLGEMAFSYCRQLCEIIFLGVPSSIGAGAFSDVAIESIVFPEGVLSIERGAFSGCDNLKNITFPQTLTAIEEGAFEGCTSLETVHIPQSVTVLGENAFADCSLLSKAYFYGDVPSEWGAVFWYGYSVFQNNADDFTIYYPADKVTSWTTPFWTAPDENVYSTATFIHLPFPDASGDMDGDGLISSTDTDTLVKYFAGWQDSSVNIASADVDGDGCLTRKDSMILSRYLSGWTGYKDYFKFKE